MTKKIFGTKSRLISFFEKLNPNKTVLDIGCGYGRDLIPISKLGFKCTGIDKSKEFLKIINEEAPKIKTHNKDIREFFPKVNFDIIISSMTLQFLDSEEEIQNIINKIKSHTNEYNIIILPLEKAQPKFKTIISKEKIEKLYKDWEIIKSNIVTRKTLKDKDYKALIFLAKKK